MAIVMKIKERYEKTKAWGLLTSVDLYDCNPQTLKDPEKIRQSVKELGKIINANLFGDTIVVRFGANELVYGYSMLQLIDSSNMAAHYAEDTNRIFFDMFSCKPYEPQEVINYLKKFYGAKSAKGIVIFRGIPKSFHTLEIKNTE